MWHNPNKNAGKLFIEIDMLILKSMWKWEEQANYFWKIIDLQDCTPLFYNIIATVIKKMWDWWKNRDLDERQKMEKSKPDPHING